VLEVPVSLLVGVSYVSEYQLYVRNVSTLGPQPGNGQPDHHPFHCWSLLKSGTTLCILSQT